MRTRGLVPNLLTLTNLFMGFYAIILVSQEKFIAACWLIVVATILDGLDGFVARIMRQGSAMGAELDSFSDAVSFGLAPGVLIYSVALHDFGLFGLILAYFPVLTGVIRLARFKILAASPNPKRGFIGMPIPSNALILVSFYLFQIAVFEVADARVYLSLVPALSLLMISPIPYRRLPVVQISHSKRPWIGVSILISATVAVLWNPSLAIFPLMMIYLLTGPVEWILTYARGVNNKAEVDPQIQRVSGRSKEKTL